MRFREKAKKRSVEYRIGFSVAAELYTFHQIDKARASAKLPAIEGEGADYFVRRYQSPKGRFYPNLQLNSLPSKKNIQHDDGFHDALSYALYSLQNDGPGTATKEFIEKANKRSEEYRIGFFVAWELFMLHQIETRPAPAQTAR